MATKHKNIYLVLTAACFIGIILVFIFDGYIGVYDSLVMDNGQYPQTIEADQWAQDRYSYLANTSAQEGQKIVFTYEVDNRTFSAYSEPLDVSLWYNQEKIADLLSETLTVGAFDSAEVEWTIDTAQIVPPNFPEGQSYNPTVVITRGGIERRILVNVYPLPIPVKPVPQAVG